MCIYEIYLMSWMYAAIVGTKFHQQMENSFNNGQVKKYSKINK